MKNKLLKTALGIGTGLLLWSIPSCNLFAVIAVIMGWLTNSACSRKAAYLSGLFYIIAVISNGITFFLLCSVLFASKLIDAGIAVSVIAGLMYILSAVMCFIGGSKITDNEDRTFFD